MTMCDFHYLVADGLFVTKVRNKKIIAEVDRFPAIVRTVTTCPCLTHMHTYTHVYMHCIHTH